MRKASQLSWKRTQVPRSKLFTTLFVALPWMITSAKLEWGGDSPDQQQVGAVKDTRLRVMIQYCTGVVVTKQCTWLVGRLASDTPE